ncbi:hypothetical protein [Ottowia thiooxydans]|uniref:hypothetical protein n=1 Tax=Ottowia thiooxydans TaxID=219182 RepID=UPI0004209ED5|nr:hypothetical protein [Ottowia thiooxydans]
MPHQLSAPRALLAAALASAFLLASCGGGSDTVGTGEVTISHLASAKTGSLQKAAAALPAGVDSMQVKFLDASGAVVHGPVEVLAGPTVAIQNVPLTAKSATVDYLRNGGYSLANDDEPIAWDGARGSASPVPTTAGPSTTKWQASMDDTGIASLKVAVNGGAAQDFLAKGVAYSPAPIGSSNKDGPSFGDLFWDTPGGFLDFELVWKRDLENIRKHGFNSLRTYSLIANFIKNDGSTPTPAEINAPGSLLVRQHKKFLDEAWNNGVNPVYVIVGIPMPDTMFVKSVFDLPVKAKEIEFWDNNFTATIEQMRDHPAVIGFTIFNEVGGSCHYADPVPPAPTTLTDRKCEGSDDLAVYWQQLHTYPVHYWAQVKKYADRAKALAPNKLIGWAFNDDPVFAEKTVEYRKANAQSIDYYGVNVFQAEQVASALDPWLKAKQGDAARPIIMTEYGLPATGHRTSGDPLSIYSDEATVKATANAVGPLINASFKHPAVTGMFYFEWSDEWWKQSGGSNRNDRQEGTPTPNGFPNKYWDEEGFGLNSIALGDRAANQAYTDNYGGKGGNLQVDKLTPRTELLNAVTTAFKGAEQTRKTALGLK